MTAITVCRVTTDGEMRMELIADATFSKLRDLIGARLGEYVHLGDGKALLVDEEGLCNGKPINPRASKIAGHPIVGDALGVVLEDIDGIPYE